jgi:Domain of unknown function (DUF4260)
MKYLLKLEELAMLGTAVCALVILQVSWWWWPLLVFGPDISMLGYFAGNKTGAYLYNLFHHKAVGIIVSVLGIYFNNDPLLIGGIVLFGHSSMDRVLGYGLKTDAGFKFTHLGPIGKENMPVMNVNR